MRLLKALVIGMGAAIVLGIAALAWLLLDRWGLHAAGQGGGITADAGYTAMQVPTPDGMRFEQMTATADRVLLRFSGPEGERIVVVDPRSGQVTGSIAIPPPPK